MVEGLLYAGLGALAALLAALLFMPLVHNRAVRLTRKRLAAETPVSLAEIKADRDQLRAEHAIALRKLEQAMEDERNRTAARLADEGRRVGEIARQRDLLADLEAQLAALRSEHEDLGSRLAARLADLDQANETIIGKDADIARLSTDLDTARRAQDAQRIELVALNARLIDRDETIRDQQRRVTVLEADHGAASSAQAALAANLAAAQEEARRRAEEAGAARADRDRSLAEADLLRAVLAERRLPDLPPVDPALEQARARIADLEAEREAGAPALRETIATLAAELAAITARLEGPGSPVERAIATEPADPAASQPGLAERIRRLRASPAG
jgi:DNA repair exonuclease SbcCD ATPase subunit